MSNETDYIKKVICPKCKGNGQIKVEHKDYTGSVHKILFNRASMKLCNLCRGLGLITPELLIRHEKTKILG